MNKQRFTIERPLNSRSVKIIWQAISTAEGLSKWLADEVRDEQGSLSFLWGEPWRHQEIRRANVVKRDKYHEFAFRWQDEQDEQAVISLKIDKSDITGDFVLTITDFAPLDEHDTLQTLWEDNLERLHRSTGL